MDKLTIDFFEFQVLVEAAWFSGTILRYSIMQKAINNWYDLLTYEERVRTYEFFLRTKGEQISLDIQKRFIARYNPGNQFHVYTRYKDENKTVDAYFFQGKYWIDGTRFIAEDFIIDKPKKKFERYFEKPFYDRSH